MADGLMGACPHCWHDEYVLRFTVSGSIQERHRFSDGAPTENAGMWDTARLKQHTTVTCGGCGQAVGTVATIHDPLERRKSQD